MALVYRTTLTDNSNVGFGSSYTFSSVAIGAASANRLVIVGIMAGKPPGLTIGAVTIGGVSATSHGSNAQGASIVAMVSAIVPTGTTANIVIPMAGLAGTSPRAAISVWTFEPTSPTLLDIALARQRGGTAAVAADVSIVPGGACVGFGLSEDSSATLSLAWTGSDTFTKHGDTVVETTWTVCGFSFVATQTSTTDDATLTSSASASKTIVVASWAAEANDNPVRKMASYRRRRAA